MPMYIAVGKLIFAESICIFSLLKPLSSSRHFRCVLSVRHSESFLIKLIDIRLSSFEWFCGYRLVIRGCKL